MDTERYDEIVEQVPSGPARPSVDAHQRARGAGLSQSKTMSARRATDSG
jgi:hypothetical protein